MRTGRRMKVETLPEEERIFIIRLIDTGASSYKVAEEYEAKFKKTLSDRAVRRYVAERWLPTKIEAEQATAEAAEFIRLKQANPDIPDDVLLRAWLKQRLASPAFQKAVLDPKLVLMAQLELGKRDLEQRRVEAIEETGKTAKEKLQFEREKFEALQTKVSKVRRLTDEVLSDDQASPEEVRKRIREVYGLLEEPGSAQGSDPAAAVSGKVGLG